MTRNRLLVIHLGALGDFVLTFPSIIALKENRSAVDVLAPAAHGELALRLGLIDHCYAAESAIFASAFTDRPDRRLAERLEVYREVVCFSFSTDLEKNLRALTSARLCRIPPRPKPGERIHVARFLLEAVHDFERIAGPPSFCPKAYSHCHPAGKEAGSDRRPLVLIHPGAGSPSKMWPLALFLALVRHPDLSWADKAVVLGPAERFMKNEAAFADDVQDMVILPSNISELLTLLENASGFVGNDSGVSHLAGFFGLPTVAIFGPSDPERWRPLGPNTRVVSPLGGCEPCFETDPNGCKAKDCFKGVSLAAVMAAVDETMGPRSRQSENPPMIANVADDKERFG